MRSWYCILVFLLFAIACPASVGSDTTFTVMGASKNGVRKGSWTYYDQEHRILKIEKYRKGKLVKTFIFNQSGHVIQRINRKGVVTKLRACGC